MCAVQIVSGYDLRRTSSIIISSTCNIETNFVIEIFRGRALVLLLDPKAFEPKIISPTGQDVHTYRWEYFSHLLCLPMPVNSQSKEGSGKDFPKISHFCIDGNHRVQIFPTIAGIA